MISEPLPSTVSALRITSALIGIATVAGLFFLVRRVWGVRMAFFAGAFLAVGRWHTTFSVYERSVGRVDRVRREDLRGSLTAEEERWSRALLEESQRAFAAMTSAW